MFPCVLCSIYIYNSIIVTMNIITSTWENFDVQIAKYENKQFAQTAILQGEGSKFNRPGGGRGQEHFFDKLLIFDQGVFDIVL